METYLSRKDMLFNRSYFYKSIDLSIAETYDLSTAETYDLLGCF